MLKVANVTSFYGKTPAIWNIDIQLAKGDCLSIIGRNGVGKTTLLKAIMGLTTRSDGKIIVDDLDLSHAGTHKRAIAGLGYVPQGRGIISKFTIRENLFLGTFASGTSIGVIPDICLEVFPYLRENLDRKAGTLSGGQMQQLAIARALATDPKVLLLDEPTEGIQPNIVADIYDKLSVLNKEMGITMVLTEQHIKLAKLLSDKYIVLDVGRIVQRGDSRKLTDDILDKYLSI